MSIWRGAQSAIFFYVSCTPCFDRGHRKRRLQQAARDERERQEVKKIHPDYPQQAGPGSMNSHWQPEMEAGPHWDGDKERYHRERAGGRKGGNDAKDKYTESQRGLKTSATQSSVGSKAQSSVDGILGPRQHMVYQRPDEELWGMPSTSTVHLPSRPTTARSKYYPDSHPAVNDQHPPLTRKITRQDEVAWMLQPVPVAAVMKGLEAPARSRSNSDLSKMSRRTLSKRHSLAPIEADRTLEAPFEYEEEAAVEPEVTSPDFHTPKSDAEPEEWVYAQTRREVSARRSLEW